MHQKYNAKNINAVFKLICKRYGIIPGSLCWIDFEGRMFFLAMLVIESKLKCKQICTIQITVNGQEIREDSESNTRSESNKCQGSRSNFL